MYQNIYISRKDWVVHLWDDEKGYVTFPYPKYAYRKQVGGKYKSIYGDDLTKIYNFDEKDPNLFESDVAPELKVLSDLYENSDEPSKGHRLGVIDIEVSTEDGYPDIKVADKEITGITIYDAISTQYTIFILDKDGKIENKNTPEMVIKSYDDEDTMLMGFLDKWQEVQFSIVTGWNIDYFDMPYLYLRLKHCLGAKYAKFLSPIGACYINPHRQTLTVGGIAVLDYILLYKKFQQKMEPTYALGPIGKKTVGIDKIKYDGSLMDLYNTDINKFLEYNMNDVKIVVAIDKKLQYIDLAKRICHVGHVPYENFHMSSRYLDGAILLYLKRNGGRIAPNKPAKGEEEYADRLEDGEEGFAGAYVKEPKPGRYNWVFDLDLTSMYPNIIISLNISPETKAGKVSSIDISDDFIQQRRKEIKDVPHVIPEDQEETYIDRKMNDFSMEAHVRGKIKKYMLGQVEYTPEDFKKLIEESNYSLSSNGVLYRTDKRGVIPEILDKWFQERKDMRKKASECRKNGDMEGYFFYNQRQQVWKILLNSMYGVLGLPIFRFYDVDNAEAVTITGVSIIKTTAKAINSYYKSALEVEDGDWVIYSDTDSCFVDAIPIIKKRFPETDFNNEAAVTDAIMTVTTEVQKYVNDFYNIMAKRLFNLPKHTFDAKQEVISKTSFWLAKKRYAQWIIHKEGSLLKEPELEVKGIDVVRTSFPAAFRTFMEKFLKDFLTGIQKDVLDEGILKFKEDVKTLDIVQIAKNTSVRYISQDGQHNYNPESRKPFEVIKGTPAQVKACLHYNDLLNKWGLTKDVEPIHHSQKIKWLYLKDNEYGIKCMALKADGNDPKRILDFVNKYVDRTAMFEQELKSKMANDKGTGIYDVMNWTFPNPSMKISEQFFG